MSVYQPEQKELQCNRWRRAHFRSQARQSQNMPSTFAEVKRRQASLLCMFIVKYAGLVRSETLSYCHSLARSFLSSDAKRLTCPELVEE